MPPPTGRGAPVRLSLIHIYGTKPEFQCVQMSDLHYLKWLVENGYQDPFGAPHWIQFVFTTGSNWPTPEFISTLKQVVPNNAVLGIIAAGAQQFPILAQALIMGALSLIHILPHFRRRRSGHPLYKGDRATVYHKACENGVLCSSYHWIRVV